MTPSRLLSALVLPFLLATASSAGAQEAFPSRTIRMIVPFGAGGSGDIVARTIAESMQADLGQAVIVDNRPGAGGTVGTALAAKARPDGYTILLAATPNFAINQSLYGPAQSGNLASDFIPLALIATAPNVVLAGADLRVSNLKELIAVAKQQPLFVATGSVGSTGHLAGAMLALKAGVEWQYMPHQNPILPLLAGTVPVGIYTIPASLQHVKAGKLKALAVTGTNRTALAPDIPTVAESGYPGFEAVGWFGLAAPAGTPPQTIKTLEDSVQKALDKPPVRAKLTQMGNDITFMDSAEFARFAEKERQMWAEMVKLTGAKP
jgi:tripartite-type tricarboxylate transporter receptor subunit TctC